MNACFYCGGTIKEHADGSAMCDTCFLTFCCDGVVDISDMDLTLEEKAELKKILIEKRYNNINE